MIPVKLRISGFLSYRQPVEIDFSNLDVACITGSNGAGKSSLLDAITWALFGQARRRDDALINSQASAAEVTLDFDYENDRYQIQRIKPRDKTGILEFRIQDQDGRWLPLTEHSLRETEARIQQTLRLDYETFTNASFFLQGKADQFSQQKPSDRKRILSSILGLEVWESYKTAAAEERRGLENELTFVDRALEEIAAELGREDERKTRVQQIEEALEQLTRERKAREENLDNIRRLSASVQEKRRLVDTLAAQAAASHQRLETINIQLAERLEEETHARQQIAAADQIQADYADWQAALKLLEEWDRSAASFHKQEALRRAPLLEIETQRARISEEVRALLNEQLADAARVAQLEPLTEQLAQLNARQSSLQEKLAARPALEASLQELQQTQSDLQAENKRLKVEMREIKEHLDAVRAVAGAVCPFCGQTLGPQEREAQIAALEANGKQRGDRHRQNEADLVKIETERSACQENLSQLRQVEGDLRQTSAQLAGISERVRQLQDACAAWQHDGLPRLAQLQQQLENDDFAQPARTELATVDAALKELGYDAAQHDAIRQREQQGRASQQALQQLEQSRAALAPLQREVASLQQQLSSLQTEAGQQQAAADEARKNFEAEMASLPDLHQAEDEFMHLREQENTRRMELGGARQALEVLKSQRARQAEFQVRRADLTGQIGRLKLLERAFSKDGVPALLIEQALPDIEEQANLMLDRLSNGSMSINFNTQRDYKNRAREDKKETLDILINDAAGSREYEMFSGGEAFRVNFAIRLALSRVLAQRAGARLQVLVIDEGFGSQDADGIQRLIEAINLVRQDFAKILVITHLESMKDAFPARIEVEKTPLGSTVKVVNL